MDWVVDARDRQAVADAIVAVVEHLHRHEKLPGSADLAATAVHEAITATAAGRTTLWVRLSWEGEEPTLTLRASDDGLLTAIDGDSVWMLDQLVAAPTVEVGLPVARAEVAPVVPPDLDLRTPDSAVGYQGLAAAALAGRDEQGATVEEVCSAIGWNVGETAVAEWSAGHDGRPPTTAAEAADAFCEFINRAGADFFVMESSDRHAVIANRRCPFGAGVTGAAALCHSTSALAGSIVARSNGQASVVLDETIAEGDARCRMVIDLDRSSRYGQNYRHPKDRPPRGAERKRRARRVGFRVEMSLQLPRDHQSVTLTRHLIAYAMTEIGVRRSDVDDVSLAVTEATANVIHHAVDSDDYQVILTIGADEAEIRVVDRGHGFDYRSLEGREADQHAERGRGLVLMNALVDQARFASRPERGTIVHLTKKLHFEGGPAAWLRNPS